jgi:hypothetical protein
MPEVQEVFRMATQKVHPEPGFVDRQYDYRGKQDRRRKIGALALVAAIAVVATVLVFRSAPGEQRIRPASQSPGHVETPTTGGIGAVEPGAGTGQRVARVVDGVAFSFEPEGDWEDSPGWQSGDWPRDFSLNKSIFGPQGAEAIIFWTSFPNGARTDLCDQVLSPAVAPTAADLADAMASAPGTELIHGPSDASVGGRPAKQVELTVREDTGCDPGFFYSWPHDQCQGACWLESNVGDTIRVWIVEVHGVLFVIEAETTENAPDLDGEIRQIVQSTRFD